MQALLFKNEKTIELQEMGQPYCGADDVIVRNVRAGICGTDIAAYLHGGLAGGIFPPSEQGHEFGHEMVGYVDEVGENVKDITKGDRVFVHPINRTDNPSAACMASGFSQYVLVQNAKVDYNIFILPDALSFDEAVLIEPYSVGTHGKNSAQAKPEDNVVVYGAGTIGLCALSSLVAQGNKKVVVIDIDDHRLETVKQIGGIGFNPLSGDTRDFLIEQFGEIPKQFGESAVNVDAYIDCAGASNIPTDFLRYAKMDARLSCVALHKKEVSLDFRQIMSAQAHIIGSKGYTNDDINEVISNLTNKASDVSPLITHNFKLSEFAQAFETASNPKESIKVVFDME